MQHNFTNQFLYAFIAIFPIVNPIAMSSVFFSMTEYATEEQKILLAKKVTLYGIILLMATLLIGPYLLAFFGLQPADIRIAGGLVLFSIAWKMLSHTKESDSRSHREDRPGDDVMSLAFFPLTMPLTAGAGSIAIVVALATQAKETMNFFDQYISIALAILATFTIVYICYRYADAIFKMLGKTGSKVVTSLSAFILLAIGVSVIWSGLELLILSVK
jgi:multiple antibiotic resistance protein